VVLLRLLELCVDTNYSSCESVRIRMGVRCIDNTHSVRRILSNIYIYIYI